jgi:hypothetical protein
LCSFPLPNHLSYRGCDYFLKEDTCDACSSRRLSSLSYRTANTLDTSLFLRTLSIEILLRCCLYSPLSVDYCPLYLFGCHYSSFLPVFSYHSLYVYRYRLRYPHPMSHEIHSSLGTPTFRQMWSFTLDFKYTHLVVIMRCQVVNLARRLTHQQTDKEIWDHRVGPTPWNLDFSLTNRQRFLPPVRGSATVGGCIG